MSAETADEAFAWQIAFSEAAKIVPQTNQSVAYRQQSVYPYYPPQSGAQIYYIPNYYGPGQNYYLPPGANVVYIDREPYYKDPDTGLMYGLLLGSALFWPWMTFPFFWGCW